MFIFFMLNGTQGDQCKSNPTLFKLVSAGCVQMIRQRWVSEAEFWTDEQHREITKLLLTAIFTTPPELRPFLVESFRTILVGSFPAISGEVVGSLLEILSKQGGNTDDLVTILEIIGFWAEACENCVIPMEAIEQIENLNIAVTQILVGIGTTDHGCREFEVVRLIAQILRGLTKKLSGPFTCDGFQALLELCFRMLTVSDNNDTLCKCKADVLDWFIVLCREMVDLSNENEARMKFAIAFRESIGPELLKVLVAAIPVEKDQNVLSYMLYGMYLLFFHKIGTFDFLTPEFITSVLIPYARLTQEDIDESSVNPLQFLYFNFSLDCSDDVITTRTALASIMGVLVKDENLLDPLYDFLLAPTADRLDFEARLFLMTKYIRATLSKHGPMIEWDVVEAIGSKLKEREVLTPWLMTSILVFLSATVPYMDPGMGCQWATECITHSTSEIVLCAASELLRSSIVESDDRVRLPIDVIIPKLLQLAHFIRFPGLTTAVEAVIQISGPDIYPYVCDTMKGMFNLCFAALADSSSEDCSETLYSMFEIVNAIPDDTPVLIELSEFCLPMCIEMFERYPDNTAFNDIFLLIAAFNSKIDNVTETMYHCLDRVLDIINADETLMNSMQSISYVMCPIILSAGFVEHQEIAAKCFEITARFVRFTSELGDIDLHAYSILIAGTLILVGGQQGFVFLEPVCHAIVSLKDNSGVVLFSSCVYAIACALVAENSKPEEILASIPAAVIDFMIAHIGGGTLQTYKELKIGFIVLLLMAQCGRKDAYVAAVNCLEDLTRRKHEQDLPIHQKLTLDDTSGAAEFPPLVIAFAVRRIDMINPFLMFVEITNQGDLFGIVPPDKQPLVRAMLSA